MASVVSLSYTLRLWDIHVLVTHKPPIHHNSGTKSDEPTLTLLYPHAARPNTPLVASIHIHSLVSSSHFLEVPAPGSFLIDTNNSTVVHPCITTPSPHLYMSLGTSSGRLLHIYTIISPWISPLDFIFCVISLFCGCHPGHQTFYPNLKSYLLHPPGIGTPSPHPFQFISLFRFYFFHSLGSILVVYYHYCNHGTQCTVNETSSRI